MRPDGRLSRVEDICAGEAWRFELWLGNQVLQNWRYGQLMSRLRNLKLDMSLGCGLASAVGQPVTVEHGTDLL